MWRSPVIVAWRFLQNTSNEIGRCVIVKPQNGKVEILGGGFDIAGREERQRIGTTVVGCGEMYASVSEERFGISAC